MLLDSVWGRGGAQVSLAFCHCVVSPLKPLLALRPVGHSACAWPQTSTLWFLCYRPQVNQGRATVCGPVIFSVGRGEAPWIWLSWPSRAAGLWTSPTSDLKCCFVLICSCFCLVPVPSSGGHGGVWLPGPARRWADDHRGWDHHQHQEGGWRLVGGTDQWQERFVPWQLCKSEYKAKPFSCLLCGFYCPKLWRHLRRNFMGLFKRMSWQLDLLYAVSRGARIALPFISGDTCFEITFLRPGMFSFQTVYHLENAGKMSSLSNCFICGLFLCFDSFKDSCPLPFHSKWRWNSVLTT